MKRKFLLLLCLVTIVALVCTSCDALSAIPGLEGILGGNLQGDQGDQNETCEHTFSDKWSTNSTEHWHAATCEHATEKSGVAAHSDADENGKCDVCDYEIGHTHTWTETWSSDENYHWKDATCSHTDEKGELAAHIDSAKDGSCDVCAAHVHAVDIYGKCTVCGEQVFDTDVTDIEVILPIILASKNNVTGGKIINDYLGTSVAQESISAFTQTIDYLLGNAASFYKAHYYSLQEGVDFDGHYKYEGEQTQWAWYELLADDTVSGIFRTEYEGEFSDFMIDDNPTSELIGGYYFAISTLADAYGPENTLKVLYDLSQSASASEYVYNYDNGTYSFSYNYLYVNSDTGMGEGNHVDYYEVAVSFTVSAKGTLTGLNIQCDCYTNSVESEWDQDYTYDQNTNTITLKDTAVADVYTFVVTQTEGERTYVAEYSASDFIPEDFDVFVDEDCTVGLGDTITITLGDFIDLYFGNCTPENSNVAYIIDSLVVNADENIWGFGYGNNVSLYAYAAGTYPVEIILGGKTFSFTIVVEDGSGSGDIVAGEDEFVVETTDTYGYIDEYTFTAPGSGTYVFSVPAGLGWYSAEAYNQWADAEVGFYDNEFGATVTVELTEGEEYVYFIAATTKGEWLISYTYTAGDVEGGDNNGGTASEVVGGTYYGSGYGTCTLVIDTDASTVTMAGNVYEYTFADGVMTVFLNGNAMSEYILGVTLNSDGVPTSFVYNGNTYVVEEANDDMPTSIVEGTYLGTDYWDNQVLTVIIEGNTVTFIYDHPMAGNSSIVATYEIVNGIVTLYSEDGVALNPLAGNLVIDGNGVPTSADYNGSYYALTSDGESGCEHAYEDGVCTLCGEVCEHVYEENTFYHHALVNATCVTPGVAVFECIYCYSYYTEETPIDSEAHAFWGEEEIITPANCLTQTNGIKKVACTNEGCTATEEQEIDYYYAHNWDVQKDVYATCTEDGEYYAVCTICEEVESYTYYAEGHYNWYLGCGESGECMECGETFTTPDHSGDPATCTDPAYCYNCWSYYGEALGHNYVDGVCTICYELEGAENAGSGTEDDPYVLSILPESITFNSDTFNKVFYIFTATQTGTITFTWPTADSWGDIFELNENGENTGNDTSACETETFSFEITEGTSYRFSLGTWAVAGEVTIIITVA